jgi:hypothetical protein
VARRGSAASFAARSCTAAMAADYALDRDTAVFLDTSLIVAVTD